MVIPKIRSSFMGHKMNILEKYAHLLVHYSLNLAKNERLYIRSTCLAEPLVFEVYKEAVRSGVHVEIDLSFQGKNPFFLEEATDDQLEYVPVLFEKAMQEFDAFLSIRAPYDLREEQNISPSRRRKRTNAIKPITDIYNTRTANKSLKRCLCQFPTEANAREAGMSLKTYEKFVYKACQLYEDDPREAWLGIRRKQAKIVDFLNSCQSIRFLNGKTDIQFSTRGRTWINSDGQTNMPSGEVFTSPVEDSVSGKIHFNYPSIFMGKEVAGIALWVEKGEVAKWDAEKGKDLLDQIFELEGARVFGEAAIATNYQIQKPTKNILFDEKMGGTIHMAVGQSYFQTGGKNNSTIHWDMISDMKDGGKIYADGTLIYENGYFIQF